MDSLENRKIAIIGLGHLGHSLLKGFLGAGVKKDSFITSNRPEDNHRAVGKAETILICVKPLVVKDVLEEVKDSLKDKLIISVAAGLTVRKIQEYLGSDKQKIIRLMPNINVSVNKGVIGLFANRNVSTGLRDQVIKLFSKVGLIVACREESGLDTLSLIAGCGPAVMAYFMQALAENGQRRRLSGAESVRVVEETMGGTLKYLKTNRISLAELQGSVATKGGITEEIIKSLKRQGFGKILTQAVKRGSFKQNHLKNTLNKGGSGEEQPNRSRGNVRQLL